jgi:hypothetical protein
MASITAPPKATAGKLPLSDGKMIEGSHHVASPLVAP